MATIATEASRFSNLVKAELWPATAYCRSVVTAYEAAAKTYVPGTALGSVITAGTATATADSGNSGAATVGTITVTAPAKVGNYRLTITSAGATGSFIVTDPDGVVVGTGAVGTAFSEGGLAFTVTDAGADPALGDAYTLAVSGTVKYKIAVETATDGSKVVSALVLDNYAVSATTNTSVLVLVRGPAQVGKAAIVLDATYDDATKKAAVYASLEALGIQVLNQV